MKIESNKVKCLLCQEVIESKTVHDFVTCKCGNISVDGGHEYLKRSGGGDDLDKYEELSKYTYENPSDLEMR